MIIEFENLSVTYPGAGTVLSDFSLEIEGSEIVALVGESGSGKTTAIRTAIGLLPTGGEVTQGDVSFHGKSLLNLTNNQWQEIRGSQISMIFQDSGAMLNSIRTIGSQFVEYIRTHSQVKKNEAWEQGRHMIEQMGLPHSETIMKSYPFQLSGGMRQRVGIAMAMVFQPTLLLADEPTSALDVTTQAQIIWEMLKLRNRYNTSILIVTHNLGLAAYVADKILVLKDGKTMDFGTRDDILQRHGSDYTRQLLEAAPDMRGIQYV